MTQTNETQTTRRVKYGLNVAVAVIAAVGIAVLINWIAYRQFVRFDFTATRKYSLSPQTRKVLAGLGDQHRIVTLFSRAGVYTDQARDLLDEYHRYASSVTVQHIDPARELTRVEAFYDTLLQRYTKQLEPLDQAVANARAALEEMRQSAPASLAPLGRLMEDPALSDASLKGFVQRVAQAIGRIGDQADAISEQVAGDLNRPLPRYAMAIDTFKASLKNLDEQLYTPAIDQLTKSVNTDAQAGSVANALLEAADLLKRTRDQLRSASSAMEATPRAEAYNKVADQLDRPDTMAIVSPDQVRVVGLDEMFRAPDPDQLQPGQQPELRFQGEEMITGALVSMSLQKQPMVVFLTTGQLQATGPRGLFQNVAQRLRNVNFDVRQWNPSGQPGPMGQPIPPGKPPQPEPGQKAVWVVLPIEPPNPMNPMAAGAGQQVIELLQQRLEAGDGVMAMLSYAPMTRFGGGDPVAALLGPWGITPQTDRLILRQVSLPDSRTQASALLTIERWPDSLPITQALAGMPALVGQASPLVLGSGGGDNKNTAGEQAKIQTWPLIEVRGDDLWTQRDIQPGTNPTLDPATAGGPFTIAAAAQRGDKRLIAVSDPVWASDQITTMGPQGLPSAVFGLAFPGNAELFVNSVYWLAGLDQLIAASPRTQDIRRIGAITDGGMLALRWTLLAGVPLVIVSVGVGVWAVRQRQ